jgi:hypothetical protein
MTSKPWPTPRATASRIWICTFPRDRCFRFMLPR